MWLKRFEHGRVIGRRSGYAEAPVGLLLAQTLNEEPSSRRLKLQKENCGQEWREVLSCGVWWLKKLREIF